MSDSATHDSRLPIINNKTLADEMMILIAILR